MENGFEKFEFVHFRFKASGDVAGATIAIKRGQLDELRSFRNRDRFSHANAESPVLL